MIKQRLHFKDIGNYIIYPDGKVFSKKRAIFLTPVMGKGRSKYFTVKAPKMVKVHRLVAEAFIPNPENKPEVNHKDGNKSNNNWWNLEWCTKSENIKHAHRTGLIKRKGRPKLDNVSLGIVRECIVNGFKLSDIARYFRLDPSTISYIKTGSSWT